MNLVLCLAPTPSPSSQSKGQKATFSLACLMLVGDDQQGAYAFQMGTLRIRQG